MSEGEMDSRAREDRPHALCIPCPAQGHINAMLKFAKLLHCKGFHITFVHTEFNYNQILDSSGPSALTTLPDFRFETISDGLSASESQAKGEDVSILTVAMRNKFTTPIRQLLKRLNESGGPKVTCMVSDTFLSCTLEIAAEYGIPDLSFCSVSACAFLGFFYSKELIDRAMIPLKSESDLTNGYLDTVIDGIPGLNNMRLRDFPSFIRTTDPNNVLLNFTIDEVQEALKANAIVVHTFEELEAPILDAMSAILPPVYAVGPLNLMCQQMLNDSLKSIGSNLWKEDFSCLEWLEGRAPRSVIYVNFGSLAVINKQQLTEFAWGLANSGYDFIWVIRPDIMTDGDSASLLKEFLSEVSGRGLVISWCPQEEVLMHPSIGGFLTHCGWNSFMDSISCGVPIICWPYFADQPTNCRYACSVWGIGLEINNDVKREEVVRLIKQLLEGEKGIEMRRMTLKWKESATRAIKADGKSFLNLHRVIEEVLLLRK